MITVPFPHQAVRFQMKNPKPEEKPPYLDWSVLKARTVQVLVVSAVFSGLGLYTPVILLVSRAKRPWGNIRRLEAGLALLHIHEVAHNTATIL